jgi:hypothetical protein
MVGRVLKTIDRHGVTDRLVNSADEYGEKLATVFGIGLPQAVDLWPRIRRRHEELFEIR